MIKNTDGDFYVNHFIENKESKDLSGKLLLN